MGEARIIVDDTEPLSIAHICGYAGEVAHFEQRAGRRLGLILVTEIQRVEVPEEEPFDRVPNALKRMARELDVPVVALSKLRRAAERGNYGNLYELADLLGSGAVEQDADVIVFLDPHEQDPTRQRRLRVAKQRDGPTGKCYVQYDEASLRFGKPLSQKERSGRQRIPSTKCRFSLGARGSFETDQGCSTKLMMLRRADFAGMNNRCTRRKSTRPQKAPITLGYP